MDPPRAAVKLAPEAPRGASGADLGGGGRRPRERSGAV